MKLSKSLLSVLVASTIVLGTTSSFAAVTDVAAIQAASLNQMAEQAKSLTADMQEYAALAKVMSAAKRDGAGYSVLVESGGTATTAGSILTAASGGARVYQQIAKQSNRFVRNGKRPMEILLALGAIALVGGTGAEFAGAKYLQLSQADVEAAVLSLNQKAAEMEMKRGIIVDMAKKSGATVSQTINTTENVITVSGLDGLQNYYGSGVMTLPIPMPVAMPSYSAPQAR